MKTRTMNELRQTKEYQGIANIHTTDEPKWDVESHKKYNQEKEYQNCTGDVKTLSDQGGKYTVPSKRADPVPIKNSFEHDKVLELVDKIADKLQPQIFDFIFQAVNDEMSNYYTFQDTNYLTEAGLELFEDEWFEFYHENHGKIMYKLLQNLK